MSLSKTFLQDIRAEYPSNLDKYELRVTQTGLLTMAIMLTQANDSLISNDVKQKAIESEGRKLSIPVRKKGNVTIKNVRSCTISGGQSETDLIDVVWKTAVFDIMMVPAQYGKNQIGYNADFAQKLKEAVEAVRIEMEIDIETALDAAKNQVYNSTIVSDEYSLAGNAIQVEKDQLEFFFGDLEAINYADEFSQESLYFVGNSRFMPLVKRYMEQGESNDENTAYQFANKQFLFTNRIENGVDKLATGYFMPSGSLGLLTRVDTTARMERTAGDGTVWTQDRIPGLPFNVGLQYKSACSDQSALETAGLEHLTATEVEHYQFSFDYAILTPYNSDAATKPGAIRKVEMIANS